MKIVVIVVIVVIGGTGLIGLKEAVAGAGAQVVIDLANSPSFEDRAVLEFLRDFRP